MDSIDRDAAGVAWNYNAGENGSSWQALGWGMNNWVYALTVYNGELVAGGWFTTAGGQVSAYWARWGALRGDLTGDGYVDLDDFADFAENRLSGAGEGAPVGCDCADIDSDTDVDLADFAEFQLPFAGS